MAKFLTLVIGMSILLILMYSMEKETNIERIKCSDRGGSFVRFSGEFHCVNKDVFLDLR